MALTVKKQQFINEYVKDGNSTRAYKAVFNCSNMKEATISKRASDLKLEPQVTARIAELLQLASKDAVITVAELLKMWSDIATADPNELIQHRRICCRHCYGKGHQYQWKDESEFAYAIAKTVDANARLKKGVKPEPLPSDAGGYGFRFTERPTPDCPQCLGQGREDVYVADTNQLTGKARRLYAGVKVTKDGLQVLMRDQDGAAANLGRAFGLFKQEMQISGPGGAPITVVDAKLPNDPVEAARMYQTLMKAK